MDEKYVVPLEIPCVYYVPDLLSPEESERFYEELRRDVPWEKTPKINRWVALYEERPDNDYRYRDAPTTTNDDGERTKKSSSPFPPTVRLVAERAARRYRELTTTTTTSDGEASSSSFEFNTCLCNYYEDGRQRIGWHADREEIGRTTPIASVSLGATRTFEVRHRIRGARDRASLEMASGSVVFMENVCQTEYLHSVPRQSEVEEGRINLTFRFKAEGESPTEGEESHARREQWLQRLTAGRGDVGRGADSDEAAASRVFLFGDDASTEFSTERPDVRYALACNFGTERQAAAEIVEALNDAPSSWEVVAAPWGVAGHVAVAALDAAAANHADDDVVERLLNLRTITHVLRFHDHFSLDEVGPEDVPVDGETLYRFYKERLSKNPDLVPTLSRALSGTTFRVTCDRVGDHKFKSQGVEYEMGGAMSEVFEGRCAPKMTDFDVHVGVRVVLRDVVVGTLVNVADLSKRHFLRYRNNVSIKTNLAQVLLRLADLRPGNKLCDPFCGSGTILLEALESVPRLRALGLDVSRKAAEGAAANARAAGFPDDRCAVRCADARTVRRRFEEVFGVGDDDDVHNNDEHLLDAVVSNLPWGVNTGHRTTVSDLQQTYEAVLRTCWYALRPGGRVVFLVLRGLQTLRILRKLGGRYRVLRIIVVRTSNNLPSIVVAEKLGRDVERDDVADQLARMSRYVNVSAEMYHAIRMEDVDRAN